LVDHIDVDDDLHVELSFIRISPLWEIRFAVGIGASVGNWDPDQSVHAEDSLQGTLDKLPG
jgi:hypothetical protein